MISLIGKVLGFLLSPIFNLLDFPVVPPEMTASASWLISHLMDARGVLNFFVPFSLVRPAVDFFLLVFLISKGYKVFMWVLKKVPFFGVE